MTATIHAFFFKINISAVMLSSKKLQVTFCCENLHIHVVHNDCAALVAKHRLQKFFLYGQFAI